MKETGKRGETLGLFVPFVVWALGFVLLYGGHGLACVLGVRTGANATLTRACLAVLLLIILAAQAWIIHRYVRRLRQPSGEPYRFIRLTSAIVAVAAMAASIWTGLPVLFLRVCTLP